jgi:hypothetical protein
MKRMGSEKTFRRTKEKGKEKRAPGPSQGPGARVVFGFA